VSRGSEEPAYLIHLTYRPKSKAKGRVAIVGKGLTFDAGGISLKPPAKMDEMKYDMSGGAAVLGVFHALRELDVPYEVHGFVPTSENLPDGKANKPGDLVKAMNGLTIEVLNTDAEGRLILCDALHYARRFEPAAVVDMATLTGACVIALGHHFTGIMGNDDALAQELVAAGTRASDRGWQLPLTEDYADQLRSNFADLANIGGRDGGAITAGAFLSRFTQGMKWAHLDIAGTAWLSGAQKGGTGRPVPLLTDFLIHRAGAHKA
jgi:leucyl aminopeptidase